MDMTPDAQRAKIFGDCRLSITHYSLLITDDPKRPQILELEFVYRNLISEFQYVFLAINLHYLIFLPIVLPQTKGRATQTHF